MSDEPDASLNHGYSIQNPVERERWRSLIHAIKDQMNSDGLRESIVFHGTSSRALESISVVGMKPIDISHAMVGDGDGYELGTFWGDISTAAAYADDTAAERHPGSLPVILAISTADLERDCLLFSDGATIDFPLKGLTRLDDPEVVEYWRANGNLPWREGLRDLSAIVAVHNYCIPFEELKVINSIEHFESLLEVSSKHDQRPVNPSP